MFRAASIPFMSKNRFLHLSKNYIWPAIEDEYYKRKSDLINSLPDTINVAVDGNYDSPGYSAELCAVAAIEESTHEVVDFTIVHKSETEFISGRMELEGVKKLIPSIESKMKIGTITLDKHPQVCKYLKDEDYDFALDVWHKLHGTKKVLRSSIKEMKTAEEKDQMREMSRRFILHVYSSVEKANGDSTLCRELVYSFFLHVQGIHEWRSKKFTEIIPIEEGTKVCPRFKEERFSHVTQCPHRTDSTPQDSHHPMINPASRPYQKLLSIAATAPFLGDLDRLRLNNSTSYVESFWNVCIKYRPKRKYFPKIGFERRTMLASIDFNENREAEIRGDRRISQVYECFSKSKGGKTTKVKKAQCVTHGNAK